MFDDLRPTSAFGIIKPADFSAPFWAKNPHTQTIYPRYFISHPDINKTMERVKTPDEDFIDLAYSAPNHTNYKALVVIFHGLEGSIDSHYAKHAIKALTDNDYLCVLMHFRGCSFDVNLKARAYHSGEVEDPIYCIQYLISKFSNLPVFTLGFSLGGNMLLNLVADHSEKVPISTAIAISSPLMLSACAKRMEKGFSQVYQRHLITSMQRNLLAKFAQLHVIEKQKILNLLCCTEQDLDKVVSSLSTFFEFDDRLTGPLHGFGGAVDYYAQCSALPKLKKIKLPTLVIHAADDPFMSKEVIPTNSELSASVAYEISQTGGHVGFLQGTPLSPIMWLPQRIVSHFSQVYDSL